MRSGRYPGVGPLPPGAVLGHRLSNPNDPAVRLALGRTCPTCHVPPSLWCVGVGGSTMRGRRLSRIHIARAQFNEYGPDGKPVKK